MPSPVSILAILTAQEIREMLPDPLLDQLKRLSPRFRLVDPTSLSTETFARVVAEAEPEILVTCWKTPSLPAVLPTSLRYVCYLAGSVKKLVTRAQLEQGLLLTNWGGSISRVVAEGALMHILAAMRRLPHWNTALHAQGKWKTSETTTQSLFERKVGIHGFGLVARELTKLLRPFSPQISTYAPVDDAVLTEHGVRRAASLEGLFSENDIVVELAPLTPETCGLVGEKLLRLIPSGGTFINVGRGAVVDEAALARVAREGNLQVGLDVFAEEPLSPNSPFRGLTNVALTPHLSGPTTDRRCDCGAFGIKNIEAYLQGRPLQARVTPEIYDHSS